MTPQFSYQEILTEKPEYNQCQNHMKRLLVQKQTFQKFGLMSCDI